MVVGNEYSVIIEYNDSRLTIQLRDVTLNNPWETYIDYARVGTDPAQLNTNVWIYIGTDTYQGHQTIPAANVTLDNIVIVSYSYDDGFTLPPTSAPTNSPTPPKVCFVYLYLNLSCTDNHA